MSMLCTCIRGQMSNTFFSIGGQMSTPVNHYGGGGGQMSLYTIFHRGADVRGGKCPTFVRGYKSHEHVFMMFTLGVKFLYHLFHLNQGRLLVTSHKLYRTSCNFVVKQASQ